MKAGKTSGQHMIEVINYVQKLRREGYNFDSISDMLVEQNIGLDVRWDAVDTVKRQEKNRDKSVSEVER
jgi:hypothetical protein